MIEKKADYENELIEYEKKLDEDKATLEAYIKQIDNMNERDVLTYRYIDFELWEDVCFIFFGDLTDYEQKQDSYLRRLRRYHKNAIEHLAQIMK